MSYATLTPEQRAHFDRRVSAKNGVPLTATERKVLIDKAITINAVTDEQIAQMYRVPVTTVSRRRKELTVS
jgi:hypothetical protein